MITIKFYQNPNKGSLHMVIKGHSKAAAKGQDLVCGAATTLAYTLAQAIDFMRQDDKLNRKPKIRIWDGKAVIIAVPKEAAYAQLLNIFWVVQCGAHVLAHNYPDQVKLEHIQV